MGQEGVILGQQPISHPDWVLYLRVAILPFFSFKLFIYFSLTLRIFHTPHFLHYAFSTLHIFHTPHFLHSAFSTLRIFYTPHFPHSALRTPHSALRTPRFPLNLKIVSNVQLPPPPSVRKYKTLSSHKN